MRFPAMLMVLLCISLSVRADSWAYPAEVITKTHEFGKSKIVLEIDGSKSQLFPPHAVSIYLDGELVAMYRNVGFDTIHASKDQRFFVGLSNSGIPGTAFVIFDAQGNLLREVKHPYLPDGIYTVTSATLHRKWLTQNTEVEFTIDGDSLVAAVVQGSNGQKYDLLQPGLGFDANRSGLR